MLGDITAADELYIVTGYTDMRKSIDGLCAIVEDQLHMDPRRSALYLFCGKRCASLPGSNSTGLCQVLKLNSQKHLKLRKALEILNFCFFFNALCGIIRVSKKEQIQNLLAQVDYLTKKLFGTSSEKMKDVEGQLNLFDETEQETEVVNIYRETYKCPVCSTADAMAENIKFANAMPLYRQEQDWHQLGVDFTRATLANWIIYW